MAEGSFVRELGGTRLVVIDSRAARDLRPDHRAMLDADELAWVDEQLRGDTEHLFIGTSLPFFMPEGLHMLEALDEAAAEGAWGRPAAFLGEKLRQAVDLEHWAAFSDTFFKVSDMVLDVARGVDEDGRLLRREHTARRPQPRGQRCRLCASYCRLGASSRRLCVGGVCAVDPRSHSCDLRHSM